MPDDPIPDSGRQKHEPYSFWKLGRDTLIVLFALLPESIQRISLCFTDKPIFSWLEERGFAVSWLLVLTVPLALVLFFKAHRTKAKQEGIFLADKFPKNAPVLLFVLVCSFCLLILHSCNLNSENARLAVELNIAANPPDYLRTNIFQITLTQEDNAKFLAATKAYAQNFEKTNGHKPNIAIILHTDAQRSRHLVRQIKADLRDFWDIDYQVEGTVSPIGKFIYIYTGDVAHPPPQLQFWKGLFDDIGLGCTTGPWASPRPDGSCVLVINDPEYLP